MTDFAVCAVHGRYPTHGAIRSCVKCDMLPKRGDMQSPLNASIKEDKSFEQDGLRFIEMCRQEYAGNNCVFSAGLIEGHPIEQAYLKWEKDGDSGGMLMLRADELAAIAWVANGAIWGALYRQLEQKDNDNV